MRGFEDSDRRESGPNDAGVVKPKASAQWGVAVGCGLNPKLSDFDAGWMAEAAVDEAVRNILCVGAEYGREDSVMALVDNFCWPDPVSDPEKSAALVRACFGLREAALALGAPLVSGKDSMKNDYRGMWKGEKVKISVPPTLLMTAIGRVPDTRLARSADFKAASDVIYALGPCAFSLLGSELQAWKKEFTGRAEISRPDWTVARKIYSWLGGSQGKLSHKLRSAHDVAEGGLLVALAEGLLATGWGAKISLPEAFGADPWTFGFGEGFHSFVVSAASENASALEQEWNSLGVPFYRLGEITDSASLEVSTKNGTSWNVPTESLLKAWKKEGFWE